MSVPQWVWRSEDTLRESVFALYHMLPRDGIEVLRLGSQSLKPFSQLGSIVEMLSPSEMTIKINDHIGLNYFPALKNFWHFS